ncbi:hypothetical protein [Salinicola sp. NYA28a]
MKLRTKRLLNCAGTALALAGIAFIGIRMNAYSQEIDFHKLDGLAWALLMLLSGVYATANLLLALAWWRLLVRFRLTTGIAGAVAIYGRSQLAKYVPGNVFHLAGRQALGLAAGLPGWAIAKSMVWELGLQAVAGASFGLLILPLLIVAFPVPVALVLFGLTIVAVGGLTRHRPLRELAQALLLQMAFLLVSAWVFTAILTGVLGQGLSGELMAMLCGAYVVAWLIGFVTPGAPAGVGIRELVLLFLLGNVIPEDTLLLAVVLGRVVTILGDVWFFMAVHFSKARGVSDDKA